MTIKYISICGGGLRGVSHYGAYKYLRENKFLNELVAISGSSMGSMVGLVVCLKLDPDALVKYQMEIFNKTNVVLLTDLLYLPLNLLTKYGIKNTDLLKVMVSSVFDFARLDKSITFKELYELTGYNFTVALTNVSRNSSEYCNYQLTPNRKVFDMIVISCSVPFVFQPTVIDGEMYVDGGVISDLPINFFKRQFGSDNVDKYGLSLYLDGRKYGEYATNSNIIEFFYNTLWGNITASCNKEIVLNGVVDGDPKYLDKNVIQIVPNSTVAHFSISLSDDQVNYLMKIGFDTTRNYFLLRNY